MPSRGLRIRENLKSLPLSSGVQNFCTAPWGKYTKPTRGFTTAAVSASAVPAGIIASSKGSAIAAPAPFRTVRRDRCFLVRNMALCLQIFSRRGSKVGRLRRQRRRQGRGGGALAECIALHDTQHDGLEPIVVFGRIAHDLAHGGHVVVFHRTTDRIGHQLFGDRLGELWTARRQ